MTIWGYDRINSLSEIGPVYMLYSVVPTRIVHTGGRCHPPYGVICFPKWPTGSGDRGSTILFLANSSSGEIVPMSSDNYRLRKLFIRTLAFSRLFMEPKGRSANHIK